jgi:hypothetical protein
VRIQEKAYGIDDTRPVTMAFTRDRRAFVTEPEEIRDQDNNLLATLQLKGNEK